MIFNPKGFIPLVAEHKDEIVSDVIDIAAPHFSISEWLGIKSKIAEIADNLHQQALSTPDTTDDKIDFTKFLYDHVNAAPLTHYAPEWFKEIILYTVALVNTSTHSAIQWGFKSVYQFVCDVVLMTPDWLFEGSWFSDAIIKFTTVNVSLVTILTMIQGIKCIFNRKHTSMKNILKRFPIALSVSAATPLLFTQGIKWLNKLTHFITGLAGGEIASKDVVSIFSTSIMFDFLNVLLMIIFLILVIVQFFPLITFHGRRWFNILIQGIVTPFSMSCYVFDDTRHYFDTWLVSLKDTCKKQLIYAVFVSLLGIVLFATPNPTTATGVISKMILAIGGIHTLAHPPSVLTQLAGTDRGSGMLESVKDMNSKRIAVWNKAKKMKIKSENVAIKSAGILGNVWRWMNKS
ncbi:hypothetical protein BC351_00425 [Paenibacillus ferrarius]|uniref:Uncharacterized protein n=2 Tax=Paenibacillus ferrarius TaxID=1469647 RepID=A0A1V4HS38_9BACL|nr:hypothetical protein BC351_00425 [Paenibacillus ferrarius]